MEDIIVILDVEFEYAAKLFNQKILPGLDIVIVDILIFQYKFIKISKFPVLYLDALIINAGKDIQLESIHFFLYFQG